MDYLLYISTAKNLLTEAALLDILSISRRNNEAKSLTGILLYSEGTFIQLLEGDIDQLTSTYQTIVKDQRHKNVIMLIEGESEARLFPDWSMGFKTINADQLTEIRGYFDPKSLTFGEESKHQGLLMIKTFSEHN